MNNLVTPACGVGGECEGCTPIEQSALGAKFIVDQFLRVDEQPDVVGGIQRQVARLCFGGKDGVERARVHALGIRGINHDVGRDVVFKVGAGDKIFECLTQRRACRRTDNRARGPIE